MQPKFAAAMNVRPHFELNHGPPHKRGAALASRPFYGRLRIMKPEPYMFDEIDQAAEDAADAEALADLNAGRTVSHAAVKDWLQSWGNADELPPPRIGD
jgi:predicted transcriptional regulator